MTGQDFFVISVLTQSQTEEKFVSTVDFWSMDAGGHLRHFRLASHDANKAMAPITTRARTFSRHSGKTPNQRGSVTNVSL